MIDTPDPPQKPNEKFTLAQMQEAVTKSRGGVQLAARLLNCSPDTVRRYIKRYPKAVGSIAHDKREEIVDTAEYRFWQAVERGEEWAVKFALETIGKQRGYVKRQEVFLDIDRIKELPDSELERLANGGG